jgi:hypothetical protein
MKKQLLNTTILFLTLAIILPATVYSSSSRQGRQQGPPPEAIEACEGKSVGDSVEFTGRRGESLEATCQEIEGQLAAVPDNAPKGGRRPR